MKVVRQSAAVFALNWLTAPLSFLTSAIVARTLGPEGKGVLFLLSGLTAVMTALTSMGATSGATVLYRQKPERLGAVVATTFAVCGGALLVVSAFYLLFSDTFIRIFLGDLQSVDAQRIWIALALIGVFVSILLGVADVLLIADNSMRLYAIRTGGSAVVTLALTWLMVVKLHLGITGVLWAQILTHAFGMVVLGYWLARKGAWGHLRFNAEILRDFLRVGIQQYGMNLVSVISKRFDTFVVIALMSVRDAGFYSVATSVQGILMTVPRATIWPLVSHFAEGKPDAVANVARASRLQLLILAVASLALVPLVGPLVRLLFGASFEPAIKPVYLALLGVPAYGPTMALTAYFLALGRARENIPPAIIGAVAQIALNLVLIPRLGVMGSAIASSGQLVAYVAAQIVLLKIAQPVSLKSLLVPTADDLRMVARAARSLRRRA